MLIHEATDVEYAVWQVQRQGGNWLPSARGWQTWIVTANGYVAFGVMEIC